MNVESIRQHCIGKPNVTEGFPFSQHLLVFKVFNKMFALLDLNAWPIHINVKCDPEHAVILRDRYPESIVPAYHMNKTHWNTVICTAEISEVLLKEFIDESYRLVYNKIPKKNRNATGL